MQEFKEFPKIIIAPAPALSEFELQRKILTSCLTITTLPSLHYSIDNQKIIVPLSTLTKLSNSEAQDSNQPAPVSPSIAKSQSLIKPLKTNSQSKPINPPSIKAKSTAKPLSQVFIPHLDLDKIQQISEQVPNEMAKSSNDELQKIIKQFNNNDSNASSSSGLDTDPRKLIENIQKKFGLKLESEESSLKSVRFQKDFKLDGGFNGTGRLEEESQHWDFEESTARDKGCRDLGGQGLKRTGNDEVKVKVKQVEAFRVRGGNKIQRGIGLEVKKKGNGNEGVNKKSYRGIKFKDLVISDNKISIDTQREVHENNKSSFPENSSQQKTQNTSIISQKPLNQISTPYKPKSSTFNPIKSSKPTPKSKIPSLKQGFPSYKDFGFITDLRSQRPWLKSSKILQILPTLTKSSKIIQSRRRSLPKLSSAQLKVLDSQYNNFFK